jgi:hypothetical protein
MSLDEDWIEVPGPCFVVTPAGLRYDIGEGRSVRVPFGSSVSFPLEAGGRASGTCSHGRLVYCPVCISAGCDLGSHEP